MSATTTPFPHFADTHRGLPAAAYTSDAFHDLERERVFARAWTPAGFAHELPARGDVRPVSVAGAPLLLVRDDDGVNAFHNVCRHRCLQLINAPRNTGKLIKCPYHSWAYDLAGNLRATPFFGGADDRPPPGFDKKQNGLVPVHCEVWHDWIFVNLADDAPSFEKFIRPIKNRLGNFDLTALTPVAMLDFGVVNCNWKFLLENFIEPYHVQFVHSTTTDQPLTDHKPFVDRHCLGCTVTVTDAPARDGTLAVDSNYLTLFPNFVFATYAPDQVGVHLNTPLAADKTHQRRAIYLTRDADADEVTTLTELWRKVHREDHAMCERLQLGRASPAAAGGGWLSPAWEPAVRRFAEMVYDAVSSPEKKT